MYTNNSRTEYRRRRGEGTFERAGGPDQVRELQQRLRTGPGQGVPMSDAGQARSLLSWRPDAHL